MTGPVHTGSSYRLAVSAEMVFVDLLFEDRVRRIADAGFEVEIWDWTKKDIAALAKTGATFSSMIDAAPGRWPTRTAPRPARGAGRAGRAPAKSRTRRSPRRCTGSATPGSSASKPGPPVTPNSPSNDSALHSPSISRSRAELVYASDNSTQGSVETMAWPPPRRGPTLSPRAAVARRSTIGSRCPTPFIATAAGQRRGPSKSATPATTGPCEDG